jgi:uncharacterized protein YukE
VLVALRIGDPDEIRAFARRLLEHCVESRDGLSRLRAQLDELRSGNRWADDNQAAFSDEFEQACAALGQVLSTFEDDQVNRLHDLASQYDDVRW